MSKLTWSLIVFIVVSITCKSNAQNSSYLQVDSISIPNIITPNDDGKNDIWIPVVNVPYDSIKATIYNRWGEILFEQTSKLVEWDGKNKKGKHVDHGTYFFVLKLYFRETIYEKKGSVTVIR